MNEDSLKECQVVGDVARSPKSGALPRALRYSIILAAVSLLSYILWRTVLADVARWQYALGILLTTYSLIVVLWKLPKWQVSAWRDRINTESKIELKDYLAAENSARSTLAQILGGIFVFVGLYFTAVNLKNSQQSVELSRQGQINDRYTKALQQLTTKDQPEIVIVGIYTLGRIPKESPQDHRLIMEVLTGYVRRAHLSTEQSKNCDITEQPEAVLSRATAPDMQAVMNVLAQRDAGNESDSERPLNLQFSDLTRAHMRGAHLNDALFDSSVLKGATLDGKTSLERASFQYANLAYANFETANLRGGIFANVRCLLGTKFTGADLTGTDFEGAQLLLGTDFTGAALQNANFTGVDLSRATGLTVEMLRSSNIAGATLPDNLK